MTNKVYDIAVVGGGLAGLALAIQSAKAGYAVVLFEKEKYPYHKVCGEYISLESWNFIESLGVPLKDMNLPIIKQLHVTSPKGDLFTHALPLGGFGISRYTLDECLFQLAKKAGVTVLEETKVNDIVFDANEFHIQTSVETIRSKVAGGSFGKRSNLDVKWNRSFIQQKPGKLNNYIGVKYHIKTNYPADLISLHNFENGYCGISQIEDGKCCLCYLTTARNLAGSGNNIQQMEKEILHRNPYLKEIFTNAEFLYHTPLTISQISFDQKQQVENHVLMIGDPAGMITPLCGNGMSMALHGSKLAFEQMHAFLQKQITREQMETNYQKVWQQQFAGRLKTGRHIQRFFGKSAVTNLFVKAFQLFPFLATPLIRQTHGRPFQ
ncbi:MAG: FAD-binding protein [Chitinophagaceae bacterium]|nr:FAD-binding protein [Chitinophagaceae bacterium]